MGCSIALRKSSNRNNENKYMCSCTCNLTTTSLDKTNTLSSFGSPRRNNILQEGCLGPDLGVTTFKKGEKDAVEGTDEIQLFASGDICSQY